MTDPAGATWFPFVAFPLFGLFIVGLGKLAEHLGRRR